MFFWNSLAFSMIQQMLAIWPLVPLPFLNTACISEVLNLCTVEAWLEDLEHYLASKWNELNCAVVSTFFDVTFLWDWNENWHFPVAWKTDISCDHCWISQICWYIECRTFKASSFRILNNSAGIPLYPLALFIVMLWCKPHQNLVLSQFLKFSDRYVMIL